MEKEKETQKEKQKMIFIKRDFEIFVENMIYVPEMWKKIEPTLSGKTIKQIEVELPYTFNYCSVCGMLKDIETDECPKCTDFALMQKKYPFNFGKAIKDFWYLKYILNELRGRSRYYDYQIYQDDKTESFFNKFCKLILDHPNYDNTFFLEALDEKFRCFFDSRNPDPDYSHRSIYFACEHYEECNRESIENIHKFMKMVEKHFKKTYKIVHSYIYLMDDNAEKLILEFSLTMPKSKKTINELKEEYNKLIQNKIKNFMETTFEDQRSVTDPESEIRDQKVI